MLNIPLGEFQASLGCDCPVKCEAIDFDVQLSSSSYPSRHLLPILLKRVNESALVNASEELIIQIETEYRCVLLLEGDGGGRRGGGGGGGVEYSWVWDVYHEGS